MSVPLGDRPLAGPRLGYEIAQVDLAQGMLMERFQVSSQAALEILLKRAQVCQMSVTDLARRLIATRRLS